MGRRPAIYSRVICGNFHRGELMVTRAPASVALFGLEFAAGGGQPLPLLILDGAPGTSYRLEHSWDLSPSNWNLLAPVTLQGSRLYFVESPDTNYFQRFYRAVPQ